MCSTSCNRSPSLVCENGRLDSSDLPQLRSLRLGGYSYYSAVLVELSALPSLVSIDFGNSCFKSAPSLSLHGIVKEEYLIQDLPQLRSLKMDDQAFSNTITLELNVLPSLESIEMGRNCFYSAQSLSLNGMEVMRMCNTDLPALHSIRFDEKAFSNTVTMNLQSLPSLESIDIGDNCFHPASSFSMNGFICELI